MAGAEGVAGEAFEEQLEIDLNIMIFRMFQLHVLSKENELCVHVSVCVKHKY